MNADLAIATRSIIIIVVVIVVIVIVIVFVTVIIIVIIASGRLTVNSELKLSADCGRNSVVGETLVDVIDVATVARYVWKNELWTQRCQT